MTTFTLRPCPFCAHKSAPGLFTAEEIDKADTNGAGHYAACCSLKAGGCGVTGAYHQAKDLAVAAWNRRPAIVPIKKPFIDVFWPRAGVLVAVLPFFAMLFMIGYAIGFLYATMAHGFRDARKKWSR
jgi:hypothetical protein